MDEFQLNKKETAALENAEFFRTKASLDLKIKALFQELKPSLDEETAAFAAQIPPQLLQASGRRYQGENHHGFPWRAFDHPKAIAGADIFLFRCLLLWGHGFSLHLLLSGAWKERFLPRLASLPEPLRNQAWTLDRRENPWEWLPDPAAQLEIAEGHSAEFTAAALRNPVLKLSLQLPASAFPEIPQKAAEAWRSILQSLFPR